MKLTFLSILILACWALSISSAFAQSGKVTRKRNLLGVYKYHQDGQKFSEKEFMGMLQPYPQAYQLMQSARKNALWNGIIGVSGLSLFYSQIDPPYFEKTGNPAIMITGLTLFAGSLPFNIRYLRRSGLALDLYNEAQAAPGYYRPQP